MLGEGQWLRSKRRMDINIVEVPVCKRGGRLVDTNLTKESERWILDSVFTRLTGPTSQS